MSIKRFIPIQDTFIVSGSGAENLNFGADEILHIGKFEDTGGVSRVLIKFPDPGTWIDKESYLSSERKATINLTLSEASNLPTTYSILAFTVQQPWTEGFGRVGDDGSNMTGASWMYRNENFDRWDVPGGVGGLFDGKFAKTGSKIYWTDDLDGGEVYGIYEQIPGADGGNAYGLISGSTNVDRLYSWQFYGRADNKDIQLDITSIVDVWLSDATLNGNEGLVLRLDNEAVVSTLGTSLSYYSADTHTVYRPYLELGWNNLPYSSSLSVSEKPYDVVVQRLKEEYRIGDRVKVRLQAKPVYPSRIYSTSSIYSPIYLLPETACWGIKDEYTERMVVDFNPIGTKLGADDLGNYFYLDIADLEPERYYRLLVQVNDGEEKLTLDNRNIFKVIRNGRV